MNVAELSPSVIKMMKPEDRKALGVLTLDQVHDKHEAKKERDLQNMCENYLRMQEIEYLHLSCRAREKIGWLDLIWADRYANGRMCAVELKTATGKVSEEQWKVIGKLIKNGARVAVIRSFEEFAEFVNKDA